MDVLVLQRAFPHIDANCAAWTTLQAQGIHPTHATVQDLTLAQLQSLHLGGRPGVHVPTLAGFMAACVGQGLRRPLVVEVKALRSEEGREKLLEAARYSLLVPATAVTQRTFLDMLIVIHV